MIYTDGSEPKTARRSTSCRAIKKLQLPGPCFSGSLMCLFTIYYYHDVVLECANVIWLCGPCTPPQGSSHHLPAQGPSCSVVIRTVIRMDPLYGSGGGKLFVYFLVQHRETWLTRRIICVFGEGGLWDSPRTKCKQIPFYVPAGTE